MIAGGWEESEPSKKWQTFGQAVVNMLFEKLAEDKVDGVCQRMQTDASLFCTCGQLPPGKP